MSKRRPANRPPEESPSPAGQDQGPEAAPQAQDEPTAGRPREADELSAAPPGAVPSEAEERAEPSEDHADTRSESVEAAPEESDEDQAQTARAAATVEALLFATEKPLTPARISEIGEIGGTRKVRRIVEHLNARYEQAGSAFRVVHIAGGYQMQTLPEYGDVLARLLKSREDSRLTQAAMETLAIIAYRQPVLRADVEAIRGVACGEVLRGLMEKNLVRIVGRAEEIGRPLLYGTTRHFLEVFGLSGLEDLPNPEQLRPGGTGAPGSTGVSAPGAASPVSQEPAHPAETQPDADAATGEPLVPDAQIDGDQPPGPETSPPDGSTDDPDQPPEN